MFGVHIRVHPMFWLVTVIMGWQLAKNGFHLLLIWVACVFVSILIHEFGHIAMGQFFGSRGHIVLHGFGGLAIGSNRLYRRSQRIAVCFAGPAAGFLAIGVLFLILWAMDPAVFPIYVNLTVLQLGLPTDFLMHINVLEPTHIPSPIFLFTVGELIFINVVWGLVNLLPVWPLDGGQISRDIWEGISDNGTYHSFGMSMVVAALLAIEGFAAEWRRDFLPIKIGSAYTGILFAILAFQSFQLMQYAAAERHWMDDHRE